MIPIRYGTVDDCSAALDLLYTAFGDLRGKIQPESSVFRETIDSARRRLDSQTLLLAYQNAELNNLSSGYWSSGRKKLGFWAVQRIFTAHWGYFGFEIDVAPVKNPVSEQTPNSG